MNTNISSTVSHCRLCHEELLHNVLDLGNLALTGVFLEDGASATRAPLTLVRCNNCGLVQLGHDYLQSELYGPSYGYESHLNLSMVQHLQQKARVLQQNFLKDVSEPIVVDIASNDGTLLAGFQGDGLVRVGIDPLIEVFANRYPPGSIQIPHFFSEEVFRNRVSQRAHLVTSLSVIYDLKDPIKFAKDVYAILVDEGIWHFEQSYLPSMLLTNSYDTICHEHLLYLSLHDITRLLRVANFQILDASLNNINGGSVSITAIKSKNPYQASPYVRYLLAREMQDGIPNGNALHGFSSAAKRHSQEFKDLCLSYKELNYEIFGLGASTKGNVLLQMSGLDSSLVNAIGEVNERKFGLQTPGSGINIIREQQLFQEVGDRSVLVVLPWHFKANLLPKLEGVLSRGTKVLFPLPELEMVSF